MTVIKIVYLCVALMPSMIYGINEYLLFENIVREIDLMASVGDDINGVFKPSPMGYLGEGSYGFTYKGLFIPTNVEVAMKFTLDENQFYAAKEYANYKYLSAINNTNVEKYGIPSVHYFGLWGDYVLMAITLLDVDCMKKASSKQINELDMIIIFREFVRTIKYIHGCGVRHEDIKLDNIMFRQSQGFIIDFDSATKMYGRRREMNLNLLESHANEDGAKYAKIDWKCFFVSMFEYLCNNANWLGEGGEKLIEQRTHHEPETKEDTLIIMKIMGIIKHDGLRKVFTEFARHIYSEQFKHLSKNKDGSPFYDQVYHVIAKEIPKYCPYKVGVVSWLSDREKKQAKHEMKCHPIPPIESLKDPFGDDEPAYPQVDYDYFYNAYHIPSSGKMFARCQSFGKTRKKLLRAL